MKVYDVEMTGKVMIQVIADTEMTDKQIVDAIKKYGCNIIFDKGSIGCNRIDKILSFDSIKLRNIK